MTSLGYKRRAIIDGKYVIDPSSDDLVRNKRLADATEFYRDADRDDNYKDIIQPFIGNKPNPEFIKAYPDRAKDYFTDEELKHE